MSYFTREEAVALLEKHGVFYAQAKALELCEAAAKVGAEREREIVMGQWADHMKRINEALNARSTK